jgi:hypothetical protein
MTGFVISHPLLRVLGPHTHTESGVVCRRTNSPQQLAVPRRRISNSLSAETNIPAAPEHNVDSLSAETNIPAAPAHIVDLRNVISKLAGTDRGIFGLDSALRAQIHALIEQAEALSPTPEPTIDNAHLIDGTWRLLYTTLSILGRKRARLALATSSKPGFVELGDLYQIIDSKLGESRNVVGFNVMLGGSGTFKVTADYNVVSESRVEVRTKNTALEPIKLEKLLGSNIGLLSEIFDPTGYLDVTYLDSQMRIGRDHAGNIFVLERCQDVSVS